MKEWKGYQISKRGFFEPQKAKKQLDISAQMCFLSFSDKIVFSWFFKKGFRLGLVMFNTKNSNLCEDAWK